MRRSVLVALLLCACAALSGCTVAAQRSEGGPSPASASVLVPVLVGLDRAKADATLQAAGLTLGAVAESYDASVSAGIVASQSPAPGIEVPTGTSVSIVVSKGQESVAVPNVVGTSKTDAVALLEAAGFTVKSVNKNDKAKKGTVIAQKPAAGVSGGLGSTVTITLSTGIVMVRVPNIRGRIDPDPLLKKAGLKGKGIPIHGPIESDCAGYMEAYRQRPAAGTLVPKGTTVTYHFWWEYG